MNRYHQISPDICFANAVVGTLSSHFPDFLVEELESDRVAAQAAGFGQERVEFSQGLGLLQEEVFDENLGGGVSFQLQLDQVVVYLVFQGEGHLFQSPQEAEVPADERRFQTAETNPAAPQGVESCESVSVPFFLLALAGEVAAEAGVRNGRVRKVRSQGAVGQGGLGFGVDLAGDQLVYSGRISFHLAENSSLIATAKR